MKLMERLLFLQITDDSSDIVELGNSLLGREIINSTFKMQRFHWILLRRNQEAAPVHAKTFHSNFISHSTLQTSLLWLQWTEVNLSYVLKVVAV